MPNCPNPSLEESPTSSTRVFSFRDPRSPVELQAFLEGEIRTLFIPSVVQEQLVYHATAKVIGATYDFLLSFHNLFAHEYLYSLRVHASWNFQSQEFTDYYHKNSGSWFALWTSSLQPHELHISNDPPTDHYRLLVDQALQSELALASVPAIQAEILTRFQQGATYRCSHKEGGTTIQWKHHRYYRMDDGDYPGEQVFSDSSSFLQMLGPFCNGQVNSHSAHLHPAELELWRLILRSLTHPHP